MRKNIISCRLRHVPNQSLPVDYLACALLRVGGMHARVYRVEPRREGNADKAVRLVYHQMRRGVRIRIAIRVLTGCQGFALHTFEASLPVCRARSGLHSCLSGNRHSSMCTKLARSCKCVGGLALWWDVVGCGGIQSFAEGLFVSGSRGTRDSNVL